MQYSTYYHLYLPEGPERYNVEDFNNNARVLDANLYQTSTTLNSHMNNTNNPHSVTKSQVGLGNVENKDSATIRREITPDDIRHALGYTPTNPNNYGNQAFGNFYYQNDEPVRVNINTVWVQ